MQIPVLFLASFDVWKSTPSIVSRIILRNCNSAFNGLSTMMRRTLSLAYNRPLSWEQKDYRMAFVVCRGRHQEVWSEACMSYILFSSCCGRERPKQIRVFRVRRLARKRKKIACASIKLLLQGHPREIIMLQRLFSSDSLLRIIGQQTHQQINPCCRHIMESLPELMRLRGRQCECLGKW